MLEAYARGVNAWIDLKGRFAAPEFLVLGRAGTLGAGRQPAVGQDDGAVAVDELAAGTVAPGAGGPSSPALLDQLWPRQPGRGCAGCDEPAAHPIRRGRAPGWLSVLPRFPAPFTMPQTASNEWAVDGRHTATGAPLLAGDPHLASAFPASGTWRGSTCRATCWPAPPRPGVPFLVLGHNGKIAWTFTTTGADVQDIFIETPAGPGNTRPPTARSRSRARGADQGPRPGRRVLTVRETRHGPVISDLDHPDGPIMAVAMGNLQPNDTAAAGLLALNRAASVQEAGAAAAADHLAGAEPAGGGRKDHRPVRDRPGADPQSRRRLGAGAGRRIARLGRLGLGRAVAAQRLASQRPAGQRQRAGLAAGFPGVHGPRHVRRLARRAASARCLDQSDRHTAGGFRRDADRCRRPLRPPGAAQRCWRCPASPARRTSRARTAARLGRCRR